MSPQASGNVPRPTPPYLAGHPTAPPPPLLYTASHLQLPLLSSRPPSRPPPPPPQPTLPHLSAAVVPP